MQLGRFGLAIAFGLAGVSSALVAPRPALAISPGCSGISAFNTNNLATFAFEQGEVISASIIGGGGTQFFMDNTASVFIIATGGTSGTYTIPATGARQLEMFTNGGTVAGLTCKAAGSGASTREAIKQAQAMATKSGQRKQIDITQQRMQEFLYGQSKRSGQRTQTGELDQGEERTGVAGAAEPSNWAAWGTLGYTRFGDRSRSANIDGHLVMPAGGVDYKFGDKFLVGSVLTLEGVWIDTKFIRGSINQTGLGITPYAAYKITDVFSVNALGSYTRIGGTSSRESGTAQVKGSFTGDRWGVTVGGDGNWTWGRWNLLGSLGTSYAQTHNYKFTESDGSRIPSSIDRLGTLNVGLQPSYVFEIDRGRQQFLEPYFRIGYEWDYTITKIQNHPNDRDAMRLALGSNLAFGNITGNVEGRTMLLREKQWEAGILGTLRVNF